MMIQYGREDLHHRGASVAGCSSPLRTVDAGIQPRRCQVGRATVVEDRSENRVMMQAF